MKRKVIAAVIGAAGVLGMAASSYGQGQIIFNTYITTPYAPVAYGAGTGALQGTGAGANVDAELGFFIGTATGSSVFTLVPSSITAINTTDLTPGVFANDPVGNGYIAGPATQIPGYTAGPVSFEILAWAASGVGSGAGGTYASSTINDASDIEEWTEASIPAGASTPAGQFAAFPGNVILLTTSVPEPTTLALAGLTGLVSLLAYRRKQV
jgi:hypothetical protein